jgi:cytochrome c2
MRWRRGDIGLALGAAAILLLAAGAPGAWQWRENQRAEQQAMRLTGGDPVRGRGLMRRYGCAGCHEIPGVRGADGRAGPSLRHVAGRLYIAGIMPNSAANLVRWIEDPPALAPGTAMPRTGATGREARDIAAYLYTLR